MKTLYHKDQLYTFVETQPYTRKDGTLTSIDIWSAACNYPGCTSIYTISIPHGFGPKESSSFGMRRCKNHKMTKEEITERRIAGLKLYYAAKRCAKVKKPTEKEAKKIEDEDYDFL